MTLCSFPESLAGSRCKACGYVLKKNYAKPPIRQCGYVVVEQCRHLGEPTTPYFAKIGDPHFNPNLYRRRIGLGTLVASLLSKLGIKKKEGCGCYEREAALNRFGWRISDMVKRTLSLFSCLILGHPKDRRRKKLLQQQQNPPLPSQEKMEQAAAKELRRQALLAKQNLA